MGEFWRECKEIMEKRMMNLRRGKQNGVHAEREKQNNDLAPEECLRKDDDG